MAGEKFLPFDASEYLDNEELIAEYLNVAAQDPDPDMLLVAIAHVARARGMTQLARDSGLSRESILKVLQPGSRPAYERVIKLLAAIGAKVNIAPAKI